MRCDSRVVGILSMSLFCTVAAVAEDKPAAGTWRALPLIKDGQVDPSWVQIGWGRFVVDGDSLRTECDEKGMGLLLYKPESFGDCQIRVTYKSQNPKSNAGVFVRIDPGILERVSERTAPVKRNEDGKLATGALEQLMEASEMDRGPWYAVHHGYEVQICDDADPNHRTGAIYSLAKAEPLPPSGSGDWRTMLITLQVNLVRVEVDGKSITSFDPDSKNVPSKRDWYEPKREPKRPHSGHLGLQNHDPGDVVYFKEVSVRPLSKTP